MADIFRIMARAYGSFAIHKFADAITQFNSLPFAHLNSGWVQCQIAKCKMEMADYEEVSPALSKHDFFFWLCDQCLNLVHFPYPSILHVHVGREAF